MKLTVLSIFLMAMAQISSASFENHMQSTMPSGAEPIISRLEQVDVNQTVSCYDLNRNNSVYIVTTESQKFGLSREVLYFDAACGSEIAPMVGYLAVSLVSPDSHLENVEAVLKALSSNRYIQQEHSTSPLDGLLNASGDTGNFSLVDFLENRLNTGGLCNDCKSATTQLIGLLRAYGAQSREERVRQNQSKWEN